MTDPSGLPTTLTTSYPTTSAGSVGYMMMSYPGRPPMVPMQPAVGMPYMPIGAGGPIMPTIMPMPSMMGPAPGMVAATPIQQPYRNIRARKQNSNNKQQLVVRHTSPATITAPPSTNTTVAATSNLPEIPKGPPVTVFVGNITEKAPDLMIRQILSTCGHVMSWKRVQAFGFCEFGNPDAALRAIRLLHEMEIGNRKLVVKVDAKAQEVLEEYKEKKKNKKKSDTKESNRVENTEMNNEVSLMDDNDYLDTDLKTIDENAKKRIQEILQDYQEQMQKYNPPAVDEDKPKTGAEVTEARVQQTHQRLMQLTKSSSSSSHLNMKIDLDTVDYAEDGKRDLISREIGKFREIMKKQEEEKELERKKREEREKERERYRSPRSPSTNGRRSQSYQSISSTRSITPESRSSRHRSRIRSRSRDRDHKTRDRSRDRNRNERDRDRDRDRERDREFREREREREKERDRDRERDRERDRDRDRDHRDRDHDRLDLERDRERERERDRDRDRDRDRNRDRSRDRERSERSPRDREDRQDKDLLREKEEEEELKEQRKRERAAREREASYQERLKAWETREKYKARDAAKEKEKRRIKEEEKQKEAKRLKEFLEDYDDERDDVKYYKGREMQRRLAEREIEIGLDNRDRHKEKEELEELKAKIYSGDSNNPDYEFAKLLKAREELYKPKLLIDVTEEQRKERQHEKDKESEKEKRREREKEEWERNQKRLEDQQQRVVEEPSRFKPLEPVQSEFDAEDEDAQPDELEQLAKSNSYNRSLSSSPAPVADAPSRSPSPDNLSTPPMPVPAPQTVQSHDDLNDSSDKDKKKKRKLDVKDVFNNDDDESTTTNKKRKLVPLDYNDDKKLKDNKTDTPKSQEEKRKHIKTLIDKIPTDKSSLFKYELDWASVDSNLMEKRIRPWIHKKIIEYIGEPEPTLVDFICSKVLVGSDPQSILDDVQMVLDEEAEVFVVKMWRLLIYEVEAKKLGLMK